MIRACLVALATLVWFAAPAAAKTYVAERYDVRVEVLADGSLRVTETIVLHFQDGTFTRFFREIPTRRTDGIEILQATIDGRVLPWGDETGQVQVSGRGNRRVEFRFDPVQDTRRTFTVTYQVHGVIRRTDDADRLTWRALPGDHDYAIRSANVVVEAPVAPLSPLGVRSRRATTVTTRPTEGGTQVTVDDIRKDGWIELDLAFASGALIAEPPGWQARDLAARALSPYWAAAGAGLMVIGLVPILALRTRYEAPPPVAGRDPRVASPPDALPPALAGALAAGGSARTAHAMATLFALADRGVVSIAEAQEKRFGQRKFEARLANERGATSDLERAMLDLFFTHKGQRDTRVTLARAAQRAASGMKRIRGAVRERLSREGLWHHDREQVRRRSLAAAGLVLACAGLAAVVAALLARDYGGWPFLMAVGLAVASAIGFVVAGSQTPLSNEGVRRAALWRSYRAHLKDVARGKAPSDTRGAGSLLALAVALGLAGDWSRHVKKHGGEVPAWFRSWSADDGQAAFVAMLAATSSTTSGGSGGGVGAGAAAGGGSSGAS